MTLKAYWVKEARDAEWGVVVVESTAQKARLFAWRQCWLLHECDENRFIDLRVHLLRTLTVPAEITKPTVIESCADVRGEWTCKVWRNDGQCDHCRLRATGGHDAMSELNSASVMSAFYGDD